MTARKFARQGGNIVATIAHEVHREAETSRADAFSTGSRHEGPSPALRAPSPGGRGELPQSPIPPGEGRVRVLSEMGLPQHFADSRHMRIVKDRSRLLAVESLQLADGFVRFFGNL